MSKQNSWVCECLDSLFEETPTEDRRRTKEKLIMRRGITLVISLPERVDRREHIVKNFKRIGHEFLFVNGKRPSDMPSNMQSTAIAIWATHVSALETFLLTESDYVLVLEDDVYLQNEFTDKVISSLDSIGQLVQENFSILQLGTMDFVNSNLIRALASKMYFVIFGYHRYDKHDLIRMQKYLGKDGFRKLELTLTNSLGIRCLPLLGFKVGAQAYIINRSGAEEIVRDFKARTDWDRDSIFGIDTWLENLSHGASLDLKVVRASRQLLVQRDTPSDNKQQEG